MQDPKNHLGKIATKAHIDNRKKLVKQQYLLHMFPQYDSGTDYIQKLG